MDRTTDLGDIEFEGTATYRIGVRGALSADWSDRLAGMEITTLRREGEAARTTLVGPIRDQAELSGVLDTLVTLHLTILSLERVSNGE